MSLSGMCTTVLTQRPLRMQNRAGQCKIHIFMSTCCWNTQTQALSWLCFSYGYFPSLPSIIKQVALFCFNVEWAYMTLTCFTEVFCLIKYVQLNAFVINIYPMLPRRSMISTISLYLSKSLRWLCAGTLTVRRPHANFLLFSNTIRTMFTMLVWHVNIPSINDVTTYHLEGSRRAGHIEANTTAFIPIGNLASPIKLTCMSLDCAGSHSSWRTFKLHTERTHAGLKPRNLLLWGDRAEHCTTCPQC